MPTIKMYNSTTQQWEYVSGGGGGGTGGDVYFGSTTGTSGTAASLLHGVTFNGTPAPVTNGVANIIAAAGGSITGITMNNTSMGTAGDVNLGTVVVGVTFNGSTVPVTNGIAAITASGGGGTVGNLITNSGTSQGTSSGESMSNNITLHKISKTGLYSDLIGAPSIPSAPGTLVTNSGTSQSTSSGESMSNNITLHKISKTGLYSDLIGAPSIPTVNNSTITIQKNGSTVDSFTTNASSGKNINISVTEPPSVSSSDNGKVMMVSSGVWSAVSVTAIYSGTSAPTSGTGTNGDIYIQTS